MAPESTSTKISPRTKKGVAFSGVESMAAHLLTLGGDFNPFQMVQRKWDNNNGSTFQMIK